MTEGKREGARAQTPAAQLICVNCYGFVFNPMTLVAINFMGYEVGSPRRCATIHLIGPVTQTLTEKGADALYNWYVEATGASPLPSGLVGATSLLGRAPGA